MPNDDTHTDDPDAQPTDHPTPSADLPPADEWVDTDEPRVYYARDSDRFDRGERELAAFVASHIPGYRVVITMGPYRFNHDIAYAIHEDDPERTIHLDCYSAAFLVHGGEAAHRPEHPAVQHAESIIHEIARGVENPDLTAGDDPDGGDA